jgi:hypothetical protein
MARAYAAARWIRRGSVHFIRARRREKAFTMRPEI